MTSKEYVRSIYPQARSAKIVSGRIRGLQKTYWKVFGSYEDKINIGEGETEAKAWKDAKDYILVLRTKTPL